MSEDHGVVRSNVRRLREAFGQLAITRKHRDALREKVAKLELVFRNSIDVLLLVNPSNGVIEKASDAALTKLGYDPAELAGRRIHEILPDREESPGGGEVAYGLADGVFVDTPVLTSAGGRLSMDMTLSLVSGEGGSALLVTLRDSTQRRMRERELKTRNSALEASLAPLVITEGDWRVSYANRSALRAWRTSFEDMEGAHMRQLLEEGAFNAISQAIVELGEWRGEVVCARADGDAFPAMASGALACHPDGRPLCGVFSFVDIARRKELEGRLREMSLHDSMTGLYNRRGFFAVGKQVIREAKRRSSHVGVLFADLDGLKEINDAHGHASGDRAIVETGDLLRSCFRESDVAARLGGDEFAVLFGDSKPGEGEVMRNRLARSVSELNDSGELGFHLALSSGFVRVSGAEAVLGRLLTMADDRMYVEKRAKRKGRGLR